MALIHDFGQSKKAVDWDDAKRIQDGVKFISEAMSTHKAIQTRLQEIRSHLLQEISDAPEGEEGASAKKVKEILREKGIADGDAVLGDLVSTEIMLQCAHDMFAKVSLLTGSCPLKQTLQFVMDEPCPDHIHTSDQPATQKLLP